MEDQPKKPPPFGPFGLPSPDKLLADLQRLNANLERLGPGMPAELQRLNANLERLGPDIHKLSSFLDGQSSDDIKSLTQVLEKYYSRIWK